MARAKQMRGRYGHVAAQIVTRRANESRAAGDAEAAEFWARVAECVRAMKSREGQSELAKLFRPSFHVTPHPYLLLSPSLVIVAANDAYLSAMGTRRSDLIGCQLFEAFPNNPADQNAGGVRNLSASLTRVLDKGKADSMECQRYDIPQQNGGFEERWWMLQNIPVFDDGGHLVLILHHVEDVTASMKH